MTAEGGYAPRSRDALSRYAERLHTLWGREGIVRDGHAGIDEKHLPGLGERDTSYAALIEHAVNAAYPGAGA